MTLLTLSANGPFAEGLGIFDQVLPFDVSTASWPRMFARILGLVGDLRRRYILAYTSTDSTHDGGWRAVDIRPKTNGHYVLSGGGYLAPDD